MVHLRSSYDNISQEYYITKVYIKMYTRKNTMFVKQNKQIMMLVKKYLKMF